MRRHHQHRRFVLALAAGLLMGISAVASADGIDGKGPYDACVADNTNGCTRAFSKSAAGQVPFASFDDRRRNGTRYTLRITGTVSRTYRRRTESFEGESIASLVNLSRLPVGSYRVRWTVRGKTVARWWFNLGE